MSIHYAREGNIALCGHSGLRVDFSKDATQVNCKRCQSILKKGISLELERRIETIRTQPK